MMKYFIILLTILALSSASYGEEASAKSIRDLMEKTGSGELGIRVMNQILPALKSMVPDAPEQFWQDFMKEVNPDEMIELTIPIYQKYLTQEDIIALNKFYDSPVGKKMIQTQPLIMQESIATGQAWGQKIAEQVLNKYNAQKP